MLKAVDIYVLLGLLALPADSGWSQAGVVEAAARLAGGQSPDAVVQWTQARFAAALRLSPAAVTRSLQRLASVGLLNKQERRVNRVATEGLLVHGVPYLIPLHLGPPARGVPTAHSAPPLRALLAGDPPYVWPDDAGGAMGTSLEPLHPSVPEAARAHSSLHELLALVDALRVGRVRERTLAARELHARLAEP